MLVMMLRMFYVCLSPCSRIQVNMEFVEMVIGRLRSDDIYSQVRLII